MSSFGIVLFNPEIPPNTGNIMRLCSNTGFSLHIIKPTGFDISDKSLKRAGRIDYKLHFDYCNSTQVKMMMNKFFEGEKVDIDSFIKNLKNIKLTPSILQYFLQKIVNEEGCDINSKKNISLLKSISKEFIEDFESSMYI